MIHSEPALSSDCIRLRRTKSDLSKGVFFSTLLESTDPERQVSSVAGDRLKNPENPEGMAACGDELAGDGGRSESHHC